MFENYLVISKITPQTTCLFQNHSDVIFRDDVVAATTLRCSTVRDVIAGRRVDARLRDVTHRRHQRFAGRLPKPELDPTFQVTLSMHKFCCLVAFNLII